MNKYGRIVSILGFLGLVFLGLMFAHGRFDGAGILALTLLSMALAITLWAQSNRHKTRHNHKEN